ncbi:PAS domain S-box-containing protein [Nitrosospira sp. Nsp14]|uniref:hybrid sensor histidine kinase/response regulator n=1 Tax=Nitrosospira sp. Nsp14 TaxID=1855333 RepID=UPI0008E5E498|nr:PAS domain S-box protein [Nitrosospira sp. Nsp14]SFH28892.1 PAS domain S-box-containing protein [Nitrosospira sp. Nsp14]
MSLPEIPGWLRGSEMGEQIFAHDWAESGLGPIESWPPHLKLAVNIILLLPSATILLWGPEFIQIYNDRFRDTMGVKHPNALGQPVRISWPEGWDFTAPIIEGVMMRRESHLFDEQRLVLNRKGAPEECFLRLTYSPVPGALPGQPGFDETPPGGVLVTVVDTTDLVNARRREAERVQLKEALQAKRIELLEEVFRTAPSFLHVLRGPDFIFEFANDAYYQLVGRRELIGRPAFEALPETAECGFQDRLTQVMSTCKPFVGFELPVKLSPGDGSPAEEHYIDLVYLPLLDENGTCERVLGHGIDVTMHVKKRKQAEEALRESEERFRRALEIDTIGVIFFDGGGGITEANDAFLKMSRFDQHDERAGLGHCNIVTPPEWRELALRAIREFKSTGQTVSYEQEFRRDDGSRWWGLFTAKQLDAGESVGYVIDITKRQRAEQNLRESEARFRALAEASPALIWQVDAQCHVVYLNQVFLDTFGMSACELMPNGWQSFLHPDDAPGYIAALEQAVRKRSRLQHRVRVKNAQGEWRWLKSYALPWFTAADEYAGHVGVSIDITALLDADRRKDEFLATLAHELRNPLAPISNALALIARPDGEAALPHLLPVITRQVDYMVRLVDDLLEISRITSGKVELRRGAVDLNTVLRNAVEASRALIDENQHKLSLSLPETSLMVYGDTVRLEQIFTNLLNNAARYTPRGGQIWMNARRDGDSAIISVRDNGIGILPDMLPRLFDMFAQERRMGAGAQEGLGIGLHLVERLVKMHGGSVEAHSGGKDQGTEIVVRLPLSQTQTSAITAAPASTTAPGSRASASRDIRVLVVDDNHDAGEVLAMLLESMGFGARAVDSGPAALAALPDYQPNVILMDIGMPGMSGYDVARHIREQPQYEHIKLVALTGWGQEKDRRLSRESGFDHHLTKPVDFKVLKSLITSL